MNSASTVGLGEGLVNTAFMVHPVPNQTKNMHRGFILTGNSIQAMNLKAIQEEEIFTGPGIPISTIYENRYDREIKVLEDNRDLEAALQKIRMPTVEINKFEVDGITLWYKMYLPPKFDKSKKYPLLIQVYAGPCSQNVKPTFGVTWITYLASKEEIVVALVDGRGTAFQGDKMMHAVYRKLGVYEVDDQISAVR
ncbi:hypothetical protein JD844_022732 [Phrynosoma platyrhinos]|uniref:Peptidase S9 prolyl oligopeptidase catalytic domain-containing protein n=1 Tax=Phrynosoma platyrhinos TaxID=52577 RepID=A0ABQ7SVJ4_PHRPL|nr:hypothetical protein JD844_022732 [Phrynosoma platyrhinos]